MLVHFFIHRPIFSTVLGLIIILAGIICMPALPVSQYPQIAPPTVRVSASYPGASSVDVESAVTTPLEQEINGAKGIKYIKSTSTSDGVSQVDVTFELERDIDLAAVDVQTRVSGVMGRLPEEVKRTGVTVSKQSTEMVQVISVFSKDHIFDSQYLSNYASLYIRDVLKRVKGVGSVEIVGERKYSMRIWLDPQELSRKGLTPVDVINAVRSQNLQVAPGKIGQAPMPPKVLYSMSVVAQGKLTSPKEFANIIIKYSADGSLVKVKDVGRVELGSESYSTAVKTNGADAVALIVYLTPGGNAVKVSQGVKQQLAELAKRFPPGIDYDITLDTTDAVNESIKEVYHSLYEAIALVVIVILLFLQNWRSTIIPAITIPVSLVGTFAIMQALGFSINTLTLFGLTLAVGLVVDDAIVVIENISRIMEETGCSAKEAALQGMSEVSGAVVAISLVLCAVFIPVAFFPGTTGQLYKQFALTIAASVALSTVNALTLTPALSGLWLTHGHGKPNIIFRAFNWIIDKLTSLYIYSLELILKWRVVGVLFCVSLFGLVYLLQNTVPSGFVPDEDQGYFMTIVECPPGSSLEYTQNVVDQAAAVLGKIPEIKVNQCFAGFSFTGSAANKGIIFSVLKPWDERLQASQSLVGIISSVRGPLSSIRSGQVVPFSPPSIPGLGNFGGFLFEVQDLYGTDFMSFGNMVDRLCLLGNQTEGLKGVFSSYSASDPMLVVTAKRDQSEVMSVPVEAIFDTLQYLLGTCYVNDFNFLNRQYKVNLQADSEYRSVPEKIMGYYARSLKGQMIPLANLVNIERTSGPQIISHYNLYRSAEINGTNSPGYSSGQALRSMQEIAEKNLPKNMTFAWSGVSLEELEAGSSAVVIFALGLLFVFLVLAAQYESFSDPLIIILSVPAAIIGALGAQMLRGLQNDVFCQIGLVMLIGLASKNAILIVEFANQQKKAGLPSYEAVIKAAQARLRPILMTSIAFIAGLLPLVFAHGAGAASRVSLGNAVCGGMLAATVLGIYIVPVLFMVVNDIQGVFGTLAKKKPTA